MALSENYFYSEWRLVCAIEKFITSSPFQVILVCPVFDLMPGSGLFEVGISHYPFLTGRGAKSHESIEVYGRAEGVHHAALPATERHG